jgi:hypothetical protein
MGNIAHAVWVIHSCGGIHNLDRLPQRRIVILCSIFSCLVSQFYDTINPCLTNYDVAVFTLAFVSGALSIVSVSSELITPDSAANTV